MERIGQCFGLKSYIRTEFGERKYPLRNSETEAGTAPETELNLTIGAVCRVSL